MESPFTYGKVAGGTAFTNRRAEIQRLCDNFDAGIHTVLISPRRWGKSSLVRKTAATMQRKNKNVRVCFIDLFNIRNEEEFYQTLIKEVLKSTSGKLEEMIRQVKEYLSHVKLQISLDIHKKHDLKISFDYQNKEEAFAEVLDLPEKIGQRKKLKVIVCIDEFQNTETFDEPLLFQQRLRAHWQHHQNAVYCLYGSKRHMMVNLFEHRSMPFYKFGDIFYMKKISKEHLSNFIVKRFNSTGKTITPEAAEKIADQTENHPYYTQQLAHIVWTITSTAPADEQTVDKATEEMLDRNSLLYQKEFEQLSNTQLNFLKVLNNGIRTGFSSKKIIKEYNLGTSANVLRILDALEKKDIIDRVGPDLEFVDPGFKLWLKRIF